MINIANLANINSTNKPTFDQKIKSSSVSAPITNNASAPVKYSAENIKAYNPSFSATLQTPDEQKKYSIISKKVDSQTRQNLNALLKTGVLLDANSNDKTTVLDSLYKMASEPRIKGLNEKNILKETIQAIANPYTITQTLGICRLML